MLRKVYKIRNGALAISGIILSSFCSMNAMVSYAFLQKGSEAATAQKLFIIGEVHAGEKSRQFQDQTATDIESIMNLIRRSEPAEALHIVIEAPENNGDKRVTIRDGSPVIGRLLSYEKKDDGAMYVKFIKADRRGAEDLLIGQALEVISYFIEQISSGKKTMGDLVPTIVEAILPLAFGQLPQITCADYFRRLERDREFLDSLKDKKGMPKAFVINTIKKFSNARAELVRTFSTVGIKNNDTLYEAVLRIFISCKTFIELQECVQRVNREIFYSLLVPITDLGFIDKISALYNSGITKIILVVGAAHQKNFLHEISTELGFHAVSSEDIVHLRPSEEEARHQFSRKMMQAAKALLASADRQCSWCLKVNNLKSCSVCKQAWYCGVDCQKQDWAEHKKCHQKTTT